MSRTFSYCRVSTTEQTVDNQTLSIENAGYNVPEHRVVSETVSGSVEAMKRKEFKNLVEHKLEPGDTLVVSKLDRLGRDNIDVQNTVTNLSEQGVKLVCLDLPIPDLSSSEGKLMLQMVSSFAEFERNRIRERTQDGLRRAKKEGKKLGRPKAIKTTDSVQKLKEQGFSQSATAKELGCSLSTIKRNWSL